MSNEIYIFERTEKKYILSYEQYSLFNNLIKGKIAKDKYHKNTICNIYLDTPNYLLIRNSIDAVSYKEKLRLRSYGTPSNSSTVFLELKKKYNGIVYKRREIMTLSQAKNYICNLEKPFSSQIMDEIDYSMKFYNHPLPAVVLFYEREAYYAPDYPGLRITFDTSVRYRNNDLFLEHGSNGKTILPSSNVLMEIKTNGSMPLWLSHALDKYSIFPTSFSKYGTAYNDMCSNKFNLKGENIYA